MAVRSARFDLDVADDFPIRLLETIHAQISDPDDARRQTPEWREWAGACNGLLYRFLACAEHADLLTSSLAVSTSPPQPERYEQEKLLFDFYVEGLSAVECLYYGVYFVGALVDAAHVDPGIDKRRIVPGYVTDCFETAFPMDAITTTLRAVADDPEFRDWRDVRNTLTHRAAPGRDFRTGGEDEGTYWMGGELDPDGIAGRRAWLSSAVVAVLVPFEGFVSTRLS